MNDPELLKEIAEIFKDATEKYIKTAFADEFFNKSQEWKDGFTQGAMEVAAMAAMREYQRMMRV